MLEKFRGKGIGKALLVAVSKLTVEEGCFALRWEVLDWNRPAIEFYEKLGAQRFSRNAKLSPSMPKR